MEACRNARRLRHARDTDADPSSRCVRGRAAGADRGRRGCRLGSRPRRRGWVSRRASSPPSPPRLPRPSRPPQPADPSTAGKAPSAAQPALPPAGPAHADAAGPSGSATAPPAPVGGGPHAFVAFQSNGATPIAYDPCRAVHYVIRPDQMPAGGGADGARRGDADHPGDRPAVRVRRPQRRAGDRGPGALPAGPVRRPLGAGPGRLADRDGEPGARRRRRRPRRQHGDDPSASRRQRASSAASWPSTQGSSRTSWRGRARRSRRRSSCTSSATWSGCDHVADDASSCTPRPSPASPTSARATSPARRLGRVLRTAAVGGAPAGDSSLQAAWRHEQRHRRRPCRGGPRPTDGLASGALADGSLCTDRAHDVLATRCGLRSPAVRVGRRRRASACVGYVRSGSPRAGGGGDARGVPGGQAGDLRPLPGRR